MKHIFIFLSLISTLISSGQESRKLTVGYTMFIGDDTKGLNNNDIRKEVVSESGRVSFQLFIKDSVSYFVENNGISSNNLSLKLAMSKAKYTTPIFTSSDKTLFFNNNPAFIFFSPNEYLINKQSKSNWVLSGESKLIDKKLCYKATTSDYYYANSDKINYEITAWFCPTLPFSFGPVYYNNLPGLILEISYLDIKLLATKIDYQLDEKKIFKPKGEKSLTFDEYYIFMSDTIANLMEELEKTNK